MLCNFNILVGMDGSYAVDCGMETIQFKLPFSTIVGLCCMLFLGSALGQSLYTLILSDVI